MNLNQPSLVQFETERKMNNYVPPVGSNSFYNIGNGRINLLTKRSDPVLFDLFTDMGNVCIGAGGFTVAGDIENSEFPYNSLTVITNTILTVNHILTISRGSLEIHGTLDLLQHSQLIIKNGASVTFYTDSIFKINDSCKIIVEEGSSLNIYGEIDIHLNMIDSIVGVKGITIDSAAVMNVDGLDTLGTRLFSMTDYYTELSKRVINIRTQSEKNFANGRIGYTWTGGTPANHSQLIQMTVLWGEAILGDFKLSVLGYPEDDIPNLQMISDLLISADTTLYITEEYKEYKYIRPELYLGIVIGNNITPANCTIEGTLIADGENALITLDRGATIHIAEDGKLYLKNNAKMRSTYNDGIEVLFIDGTLIIEDISQIETFSHDNIVIGDNGKVIILNPDNGERRLLWTTPNGIEGTDLYRLFKDRIDHIEYHISNNTGIGIDQYYEFYARDFTSWFGERRIEKAIHDGILVWHNGGFIELYENIIPWVNMDCTLLQASRLFKTFGSYDEDKLQEAVNRLKYAGSGNILFRFICGEDIKEVTLVLDEIHMENVLNHPLTNMYVLTTDNDGELFLKNNVGQAVPENIITTDARMLEIINGRVEFPLS